MVPGPKGRLFLRNLVMHGGHCDDRGFSFTDCMLREDEGAIAPGNARPNIAAMANPAAQAAALVAIQQPGSPNLPAGAAQLTTALKCTRTRHKETFSYICKHIADEHTLDILGARDGPYFNDPLRWCGSSWRTTSRTWASS